MTVGNLAGLKQLTDHFLPEIPSAIEPGKWLRVWEAPSEVYDYFVTGGEWTSARWDAYAHLGATTTIPIPLLSLTAAYIGMHTAVTNIRLSTPTIETVYIEDNSPAMIAEGEACANRAAAGLACLEAISSWNAPDTAQVRTIAGAFFDMWRNEVAAAYYRYQGALDLAAEERERRDARP
ncbi:hypothetical protein [Leifsonia sp. 22587]|uniref:hypothetical protein n=1 Tax=Leifsonia sp. 22587 TaxID=3453946 RepID=UPI003F83B9D8